jgi:allantoinase
VQWELAAIEMLVRLCRETRCAVHIVHLATGEALPLIVAAKREGLPLTVETCPHYLLLDAATIADGDTRFKCAPPIRTGAAADLWAGLLAGTIDTVGSDHSPCPPAMKCLDTGDFTRAWGGIASLQLTLSSLWTTCLRHGVGDFSRMAQWLSQSPAQLVGLSGRKGHIARGYDADLVVWDPDERWQVRGDELFHRHSLTPYDGMTLAGKVRRTYVRGHEVYRDGVHAHDPSGELLCREAKLCP